LRVLQKAFFGDQNEPATSGLFPAHSALENQPRGGPAGPRSEALEPISIPERIGAVMLMTATLVIGLYPRLLLDLIVPSLNLPLFEGLRKAGAW